MGDELIKTLKGENTEVKMIALKPTLSIWQPAIMGEIFRDFRDDTELRVAILTGEGDRFFCPGWDLCCSRRYAVDGDYGVVDLG